MKKFLFLMLLVLSLTLLVGCGKEKEDVKKDDEQVETDPMVGTWWLCAYETDGVKTLVGEKFQNGTELTKDMFYFVLNADGTGTLYSYGEGSAFTWTFADNILTMKPSDGTPEFPLVLENNTLATQDSSETFFFQKG